LLRDDIYKIGREALINAFRHARAKNVELELKYSARQFRVLVRDDGVGIEPQIVKSGRDGHWGLSGMRERAEQIGARLRVYSNTAAGTAVELMVPGEVAFQDYRTSNLGWFRKLKLRSLSKNERQEGGAANERSTQNPDSQRGRSSAS
jgi:signal transduction histidine kinase